LRLLSFFAAFIVGAPIVGIVHAQSHETDEESIRALITAFANARNAQDGEAASRLYSEDGEWISAKGYVARGRSELTRTWGGVTGQVERTVQSVDFPGSNIAVVRVITQYAEPIGRHHEVFIFAKDDGKWNIHVHQSID
jgi:uncharacterized protein (TIGR02246 family)